ncbi:Uncharacterised protein [Collinsella intestinalis]|nr:Uncharacterised protein [Collinsella intestinalis]
MTVKALRASAACSSRTGAVTEGAAGAGAAMGAAKGSTGVADGSGRSNRDARLAVSGVRGLGADAVLGTLITRWGRAGTARLTSAISESTVSTGCAGMATVPERSTELSSAGMVNICVAPSTEASSTDPFGEGATKVSSNAGTSSSEAEATSGSVTSSMSAPESKESFWEPSSPVSGCSTSDWSTSASGSDSAAAFSARGSSSITSYSASRI